MGYAATTAGRQRATVSATAFEPSTCLRIVVLPLLDLRVGIGRQLQVGGQHILRGSGEPLLDGLVQRGQSHDARQADHRADERRVGQRTTEQLASELGRWDADRALPVAEVEARAQRAEQSREEMLRR